MVKLIKLYGERNTNTNYMSKLIELNLDVQEIPGTVPPTIMKIQKLLPGQELVRDIYFYFTYKNNLGWKHTHVKLPEKLRKYKLVDSNLLGSSGFHGVEEKSDTNFTNYHEKSTKIRENS